MKLIPLTRGQFAQVDDWNYDWLMQWKWYANKIGDTFYVRRESNYVDGKRHHVHMHREIMHTPDNLMVDHIDHNGLNCLEENMRNCTHQQNQCNRRKKENCKSKYVGVVYESKKKLYRACVRTMGIRYNLGRFKSEENAAHAYDKKAVELFGEFANLNFK
jgi:hypothetical protein